MKKSFVVLCLGLILLFGNISKAYETDTHLYATYAMARYAGIKHDVAAVIASAAQWPDETELLGSPMLGTIGLGTKMRRLFHFPCPALGAHGAAHNGGNLMKQDIDLFVPLTFQMVKDDFSPKRLLAYLWQRLVAPPNEIDLKYVSNVNTICMTEPKHSMAYRILWEGLSEGNLIKAATALHTIEDSYAHAGTPSTLGHSMQGHVPDRCVNSPEKCQDMVYAVMAGLYAIRAWLPESAIDREFQTQNSPKKNYLLTVEELHDGFVGEPAVRQLYTLDMYQDPRMIRKYVEFFFKLAQRRVSFNNYISEPWLDWDLPIEYWLDQQSDLWAKFNKGVCKLPLTHVNDPANRPTFPECVITHFLARLAVDPVWMDHINWYSAKSRFICYFKNADCEVGMGVAGEGIEKLYAHMTTFVKAAEEALDKVNPQNANEFLARTAALKTAVRERNRAINRPILAHMQNGSLSGRTLLEENLEIVKNTMAGYVPGSKIDDYRRYELEDEGELRKYELQLRIENVRSSIKKLTGDFVRFIENDKTWSYPKTRYPIQNLPLTQEEMIPLQGEYERTPIDGYFKTNIKYISFNYRQIDLWVEMAIRYMFPAYTGKHYPASQCSFVSRVSDGPKADGSESWRSPVLTVRNSDDVYMSFFAAMFDPNAKPCSPVKETSVLGMYKNRDHFRAHARELITDFETTHMRPPELLRAFENTELIEKRIFPQLKLQKAPRFSYWGQLTRLEDNKRENWLSTRLARKIEAERLGKKFIDPSPYSTEGSKVHRESVH